MAASLLRSSFTSIKARFQAIADRGSPNKARLLHVHTRESVTASERAGSNATATLFMRYEPNKTATIFNWADGYHEHRGGRGTAASRRGMEFGLKDGRIIETPPFVRWVQVTGWNELNSIGDDAARLLNYFPNDVAARLWGQLPVGTELSSGLPLWVLAVFEVASANVDGSPLRGVRWVPISEGITIALDSISDWYRDCEPNETPEMFPDWFVTLDNFAAASVQAIDILMSWLDVAAGKASETSTQDKPPGGDDSESGQGEAGAGGKPSKRKRGRRKGSVASNPNLDQRIVDAWAKGYGQYASKEQLATAFGIKKDDVVAAMDRHRKREPKSEIIRDEKPRQDQ